MKSICQFFLFFLLITTITQASLVVPGIGATGSNILFYDGFSRSGPGLGANWKIYFGNFSTDGNQALSGSGTNWAGAAGLLGTEDYQVEAVIIPPAGAAFSGVIARGNPSSINTDLYSAQVNSKNGSINLYRRNAGVWTLLRSMVPGGIIPGGRYRLGLKVQGNAPVNLEVFLNGTSLFTFLDSSPSQIKSGIPGIEDYTPHTGYDDFTVTAVGGSVFPTLSMSPSSLTFMAAPDGVVPTPQRLTITNSGAGTLNWSSSDDAIWLQESAPSGTTPAGLTISIMTTHLNPGTYQGTITLSAAGAQGSPNSIPVTYTVGSAICSGQTRTPYIAFDTPASATLAFECAPKATVEWGEAPNYTNRVESDPEGLGVQESFNRPDATNLGGEWVESINDFGIVGGQVVNLDAASQEARTTTILGPDQSVAVDCQVNGPGNSCGVMARWSDSNNYYYGRLDVGLQNVRLFKNVAGVVTSLGVASRPLTAASPYRLRLAVNQNQLELFFANEPAPLIAITDGSLVKGDFAGIHSYAGAPQMTAFDNFAATGKARDKHFVTLPDLAPDRDYVYRVSVSGSAGGGSGGLLGQGSFRTAKRPGDNSYSFVVFGDSGEGTPAQAAIASLMERLNFSFALLAGDVVYEEGYDSEYEPHYFGPYKNLIGRVPFFPVAGNHDLVSDGGTTFISNFYHPLGKLYYDFHWGDTHFIALESTYTSFHSPDPAQLAWLEQTLAASRDRWKIVYFHHPPYNSGIYGNDPHAQADFVPLFEKYHVDVVFTGHAHDYERTIPINGITYFVTGGGGASLTAPPGKSSFTAVSRSISHLLLAKMNPSSLTVQALDQNGTVFDSLTITK